MGDRCNRPRQRFVPLRKFLQGHCSCALPSFVWPLFLFLLYDHTPPRAFSTPLFLRRGGVRERGGWGRRKRRAWRGKMGGWKRRTGNACTAGEQHAGGVRRRYDFFANRAAKRHGFLAHGAASAKCEQSCKTDGAAGDGKRRSRAYACPSVFDFSLHCFTLLPQWVVHHRVRGEDFGVRTFTFPSPAASPER